MDDNSKPIWLSKTYATNLILAMAVEMHPSLGAWVTSHPQTAFVLCAAINIALRHFTIGSVHIFKSPNEPVK